MAMKILDHTPVYRKYRGQWVVLDRNRERVLASDETLRAALAAYRKRYPRSEPPSVLKVPSELLPFVGSR